MKRKITLFRLLPLIVAFGSPVASFSQTGSLDLTFDTDGKVITSVGPSNQSDDARSVAIQSDGKIIVAGNTYLGGSDYDFAVVRYNADGTLDTGFDSDGKVTTPVNGNNEDKAFSVAIQDDGKIVLAGYTFDGAAYSFALVRYNTDGSLDTGFDSDGIVITTITGIIDIAYSVAIQGDGKIVAAGYSYIVGANDFAVVRYNSNGSLDTSFDTDGIVTTAVGTSVDMAYSVAIQGDGKIVVAGNSLIFGNDYDFSVVRYNSNGSLDTSFDTDGKTITPIFGTNEDKANSMILQSDGKIVLGGYTANNSVYQCALTRYNTDGSLDTGFDSDGIAITIIGNQIDVINSVLVQNDGKIVAAGYSFYGSANDFALLRYNSDGSLDTSFDTDGRVRTEVSSTVDIGYSAAIQSNGQIVVAGQSLESGPNYDFAVVRYNGGFLGLDSIEKHNMEISVYPNPTTGAINIDAKDLTHISVTDINGVELLVKEIYGSTQIDLSNIAHGIYFIRTSEGQTVKFIKE
jgi:uncharacterized delta-60 repeat protein